jgi:hypothetical protein
LIGAGLRAGGDRDRQSRNGDRRIRGGGGG